MEESAARDPKATLRAWRFDWAVFLAFCKPRGLLPLPAAPATVAAFIESCGEAGKKPATVRRYLATIACAHRAAEVQVLISGSLFVRFDIGADG